MEMMLLADYIQPLVLTVIGLVVFLVDLMVFHYLLGGKVTGIGLIGLGGAISGAAGLVSVWRERRDAMLLMAEREREMRIRRMIERNGNEIDADRT